MVTVETAISLVAVMLILITVVGALGAVRAQTILCQGAREAARAHSVGEDAAATATRVVPGSAVAVSVESENVTATVRRTITHVGSWSWNLECAATTRLESARPG